ncbi:MAG TPA: type I methionyl aminopeptidase [Kiritimatiellia bacterium]|nr:type I methionyl aminopeptidase [Kiritimatiellia bacterium]
MIIIKTPEELERMRASGQVAARIREELARKMAPGVSTAELDDYAREMMAKVGARSAFFGYRGFPGHICTSVNNVVVHGIPGPQRIQVGDLVSVDVGVIFEGFIGDTATTVMVGVTDPKLVRLVRVAEEALEKGIARAVAGGRLSDVSNAIEQTVVQAGFSVVREFVGHGVGRSMHEEPQIPNYGPPGRGPKLKAGMTLAIEPMVNLGGADVEVLSDGWTVTTLDRLPSAHVEHTVAVMDGYAEILTRAPAPAVK